MNDPEKFPHPNSKIHVTDWLIVLIVRTRISIEFVLHCKQLLFNKMLSNTRVTPFLASVVMPPKIQNAMKRQDHAAHAAHVRNTCTPIDLWLLIPRGSAPKLFEHSRSQALSDNAPVFPRLAFITTSPMFACFITKYFLYHFPQSLCLSVVLQLPPFCVR